MVVEEEEGSMVLGKLSFPLRCWSSTGGKWSAEEVEEAPFKEGGRHRNVKSQRRNQSIGAVLLQ
jgi:hypothetical protein